MMGLIIWIEERLKRIPVSVLPVITVSCGVFVFCLGIIVGVVIAR